jgi:hypothetical protein
MSEVQWGREQWGPSRRMTWARRVRHRLVPYRGSLMGRGHLQGSKGLEGFRGLGPVGAT